MLVDGEPSGHPITEENFKRAFPNVDIDNLPESYAEFTRVEKPELDPYANSQSVQYVLGEDGIVKDVWSQQMMTEEEKTAKQNATKQNWADRGMFASWTFNEDRCEYEPPTPRPDDGNVYEWDEDNLTWQELS